MPITPNDYIQPPLQIRRGHISSVTDYQAAAGELVYSTNTNQLFIGDGVTVGGILIAGLNQALYTTSSVTFYNITATNLAAGSSTYIVYYNTASGQLSYDLNYSGGGGGGSSFDLSTVTNQSLFTTSSVTFSNITATNTLTTNNIKSADSIITLKQLTGVVIEGSTDGILYSKANNNLSLAVDYPNSVGGRISLLYGENSGVFLGNHNQTQILTINTSSGVTVNSTLALNAANASITTGTITYVKSDNYLGNNNNNNLFFGNGTAQAILYANGAQNLQLSANASTGLGAKIFLETGETGSVKLGHFNNTNVMTVNTATGVTIGSIATFNSNIRATGLANSTASFVLYYNNSNNEITYGVSTSGGGSAFDLSTVTNQALFTTSTVTFNALTVSTTATISANGKIVTTATGAATTLELWNESSTIAHYNALKFFRKRGTLAVNSNQVLGAIQVDSFQTTNGYASNYSLVDTFPGIRWQAAANASANSNPTRIEILNRPTYSASLPYPYNLTNQNTTASSVIATLRHNDSSTDLLTRAFVMRDTYQGFNNTRGAGFTATSGVVGQFGVNMNGATDAGNQFQVNLTQAWTNGNANTNSQNYIRFVGRTNNVNYSSLDTSGSGQINWYNASSLLTPSENQVVKGPNIQLNATRHSLLDKTVNAWFAGPYSWGGGSSRLWNTSTQAGDVLGTISFQGGLTGAADTNVVEGAVDGVLLRAYAKNNWSGDQTSTNTNVTYTDNQSALRIEITTSTTIGALETGGLRQQYKTVFEIDGTTATFNTVVNNKDTVLIKDTLYNANKITGIASTASQVVGSFNSTAYNAAKFLVKVVEGTTLHFVEISVITDGTDIWKVEYGTNTSDGALGTFSTNLNGTVVELLFAATSTPTNMNIITAITALPKL